MSTYTGTDEVMANLFGALETHTATYSDLIQKLAASDGNMEKALQTFMESSDHSEAVKFRKAIEMATERLRKLAEANVKIEKLSSEDKANASATLLLTREKMRKTRDAIETVAPLRDGTEDILKTLAEISDPSKSSRGRPKGSAGSSTPRPRVNLELTSSTAPDKPQKFDSFSKAVSVLNVDVADLQAVYAENAGVKPEDVSKIRKTVEFEFTPPGSETKWAVKVTPKAA